MKLQKFIGSGALALALSLTMIACGDDDKTPEVVPDPMETTTEYYVTGKISGPDGAVSNATVSTDGKEARTDANGVYSLTLGSTGTYTLSVTAEGLQEFSTPVSLASDLANRSSVVVNVTLVKEPVYTDPVATSTTEDVAVEVPDTEDATTVAATIEVPAGAAEEGVTIQAGTYEEATAVTSEDAQAGEEEAQMALSNIEVVTNPADAVAQSDITFTSTNVSSDKDIYFDPSGMSAMKDDATRAWVPMESDVRYEGGRYVGVIPQGTPISGRYSIRVNSTKETGATQTGEANLVNGEEVLQVSNAGNVAALRGYEITVEQKGGWEYVTSPAAALAAVGAGDSEIASQIASQIEKQEGVPGVYTTNQTIRTDISGNYILTYRNNARYCNKTYTFSVNVRGVVCPVNVVLKCYIGSVESYTNQSADLHSGGTTD